MMCYWCKENELSASQYEQHGYFIPGRGAKYCDEYVCLSVCSSVRLNMSEVTQPTSERQFFVHVDCGHGSVLRW